SPLSEVAVIARDLETVRAIEALGNKIRRVDCEVGAPGSGHPSPPEQSRDYFATVSAAPGTGQRADAKDAEPFAVDYAETDRSGSGAFAATGETGLAGNAIEHRRDCCFVAALEEPGSVVGAEWKYRV